MNLERLNRSDGSWDDFESQWQNQALQYDDEPEFFSAGSLVTLKTECCNGQQDKDSGVFALKDEHGEFHAACFLNCTPLKGYVGKVLRVRHTVFSPYYDYEDLELEEYAIALTQMFHGIVDASNETLPSKHIKLHYRSPHDRPLFAAFALNMKHAKVFKNVDSKGMWLHITKS